MFQSGLLLTSPNPYCDNVIDYCQCSKPEIKYNHSFWTSNVISEFDLVCDKQVDIKLSELFYFSGVVVGCLFGFGLGSWVTIEATQIATNSFISKCLK